MPAQELTREDFERRHDYGAVDLTKEHGAYWLTCRHCGAIAVLIDSNAGDEIEIIEDGDESCQPQGANQ